MIFHSVINNLHFLKESTSRSDPRSDPRLDPPVNPEIQSLVDALPFVRSRHRLPTPSSNSGQLCSSPFGFFRHESNCQKYYQCSWGKAYGKTCPLKTVWNNVEQYCDWPYNVQCTSGSLLFYVNGMLHQ